MGLLFVARSFYGMRISLHHPPRHLAEAREKIAANHIVPVEV